MLTPRPWDGADTGDRPDETDGDGDTPRREEDPPDGALLRKEGAPRPEDPDPNELRGAALIPREEGDGGADGMGVSLGAETVPREVEDDGGRDGIGASRGAELTPREEDGGVDGTGDD
ncbi:MAG TPA: hypothetical protein P5141_05240, partial [Candidatus Hydrogenedentes bacterium]|nr:hypothetical protein [Candidatus Hydrogenedentota bacterium]